MKVDLDEIKKMYSLTALDLEIMLTLQKANRAYTILEMQNLLKNRGKNLYRSINKLVDRGLVQKMGSHPSRYESLDVVHLLEQKLISRKKEIESMISEIGCKKGVTSGAFGILSSRDEYRKFGMEKMRKVRDQMLLIVSGVPQSADFFKLHVDLVRKGVDVKILVSGYNKKFKTMYERWQENGIKVRVENAPGINVIIYDNEAIQMAFKSDKASKDKFGIAVSNKYFVPFMKMCFDMLWESSKKMI